MASWSMNRISVIAPAGDLLFEGVSALDENEITVEHDPYLEDEEECPPTKRSPTSSGIFAIAHDLSEAVSEATPSTKDRPAA
jgi:hypothetical protein